jgi:EmrB/QacA subfamily drug resistance transporter
MAGTGVVGLRWGGPVQSSNRIEGSYRWLALGAAMLVMFCSTLTSTIVSTATPTIVSDLRGLDLYAWVFTGYMLASAVVVPIAGKLSDIYGRRPFYLIGIGLFLLGSAAAGAAQSMEMLIAARCISGLGGGAMMAMATVTIGDIFSPRERGRWMGAVMGVFGLAALVGPTIGGSITDHWGWRWVFYVNLPPAVLAWFVTGVVLPRFRADRKATIDYIGVFLLILGIVPLLLGVTWGGSTYAWNSWQEIGMFAVGGIGLVLFVLAELRARDPLLSPMLFKNAVFTLSVAISFLITLGMYGSITFMPLFLQGVLGQSAQDSGLVLAPMMIPFVLGAVVGGQVMARTGRYKAQGILGLGLGTLGMFLFSRLSPSSGYGEVIRDMAVMGIGIGLSMPIFSTTVQSAFPHQLLGTANSARQFFSNLGGVIGVPVLTSVLVTRFHSELASRLPAQVRPVLANGSVNPQALITAQTQTALQQQLAALGPTGHQIFVATLTAIRASLSSGITASFTISIAVMGAGFLLALVFPERPLKSWKESSSTGPVGSGSREVDHETGRAVQRRDPGAGVATQADGQARDPL